MKGMAIVTCGRIVGFQEGIIDMTGPGADYTPFSRLLNLVIVANPAEGVSSYEHEETIRIAGLKAADYIAKAFKIFYLMILRLMRQNRYLSLYRNTRIFQKLHMYIHYKAKGSFTIPMSTVLMQRKLYLHLFTRQRLWMVQL